MGKIMIQLTQYYQKESPEQTPSSHTPIVRHLPIVPFLWAREEMSKKIHVLVIPTYEISGFRGCRAGGPRRSTLRRRCWEGRGDGDIVVNVDIESDDIWREWVIWLPEEDDGEVLSRGRRVGRRLGAADMLIAFAEGRGRAQKKNLHSSTTRHRVLDCFYKTARWDTNSRTGL